MKKLLIFSLTTLLIWSCSKNSLIPTSEEHYDITTSDSGVSIGDKLPILENVHLDDGNLVFDSKIAFLSVMKILTQHEDYAFEIIRSQFPTFYSSFEAFENLTEEVVKKEGSLEPFSTFATVVEQSNGDLHVEPVIDNDILGLVVNSKGYYQIANDIHAMTWDKIYKFDKSYLSDYEINKLDKIRDLQIIPIKRKITNLRNDEECDELYSSNTKKLVGEIRVNTGSLLHVRALTKNFEQGLFNWWWLKKAHRMRMDGTIKADVTVFTDEQTYDITKSKRNERSMSKNVEGPHVFPDGDVGFVINEADTEFEIKPTSNSSWITCDIIL